MKIIFLDIDGVLINRRYASRNMPDPRCIDQLNRITEVTGAQIVVSSSWRYHGLPKITLILKQWGVAGDIIDMTPVIDGPRRHEITAWLDAFGYDWVNSSFVIIDDELDAHLPDRYGVAPQFEYGLNEIDADRAIAILEGLDL